MSGAAVSFFLVFSGLLSMVCSYLFLFSFVVFGAPPVHRRARIERTFFLPLIFPSCGDRRKVTFPCDSQFGSPNLFFFDSKTIVELDSERAFPL